VLLNNKNRKMREVRISEGSLTASLVHPREVYNPVIRESAAAVIFVHNLCAATHKLCYVERRVM
jgi:DNA repair protein RadC